jgi:hypothetical protein
VEGAQAGVVGPALLQLDVAPDYVDDIDPIEEVLLERIGDHAPIVAQIVKRFVILKASF